MKPILVHIHIYYSELWPVLQKAVLNIFPHDFDLYVTTIKENEFLREDVTAFFPNAHFLIVENLGYDVGPFMCVLNSVNLENYDYVIKLHTKRDMKIGAQINSYDVSGSKWRDYALFFMSTKDAFGKTMKAFEENTKLGMVSNYRLIFNSEKDDKNAQKQAYMMLDKMHLKSKKYGFAAGSIFMCRAHLLAPLKQLNITISSFEQADTKHQKSTLAHAFERLFGLLIYAQDYTIEDVVNPKTSPFMPIINKIKTFLYYKKENNSGKIRIKICKIPVFSKNAKK